MDSEEHKHWVLELVEELRKCDIDSVLGQKVARQLPRTPFPDSFRVRDHSGAISWLLKSICLGVRPVQLARCMAK